MKLLPIVKQCKETQARRGAWLKTIKGLKLPYGMSYYDGPKK
jgi:hypothetical protein